jgi:uncharacterized protein
MKCSVKDILKNDGEIAEISGVLEYDTLENNGDTIKFTTPISFSGEIKNENGDILVDGEVDFEYEVECHRCGEPVSKTMNFKISELFSADPHEEKYLLKGEILELEDMIIDNIRLNLPVKFLCNSDCKGVCAICGNNLNISECNCSKKNIDSKFSVLSDLLK